ncbi:hypothetical protein BDW72DRAFT_197966 [Aspergillus terricola var. indicus]
MRVLNLVVGSRSDITIPQKPMSTLTRYKPIQITGFALITLGLGLFVLLDENSSTRNWVGYQILAVLGFSLIITSTLPAAQAGLVESDVASSTATWAFLYSFGSVWGVESFGEFIALLLEELRPAVVEVYADLGHYFWVGVYDSVDREGGRVETTLETDFGFNDGPGSSQVVVEDQKAQAAIETG